MTKNRRVFTLRLSDEVFYKIGRLASKERRSMTNYIELVLVKHLEERKENLPSSSSGTESSQAAAK